MDAYNIIKHPLTTESAMIRLRTTTPWSSSATSRPTSTRSSLLSRSCTTSTYPRSTHWCDPLEIRRPTSALPLTTTPWTSPTRSESSKLCARLFFLESYWNVLKESCSLSLHGEQLCLVQIQ